MSPRLPSGALLALTVVLTAITTVLAALPASAGPAAHAAPGARVATRGGAPSRMLSGTIRAQEWWLANLHVRQAWQSSRGAGVTVAVLSSGVLATHPDLSGSVITGPDFSGSGETSSTPSGGIEGTSAASIIAGHGDNVGDASGIIGIAPAARILSIRVVLDATDPLNASPDAVRRLPAAIAAGIRYAAAHGAQVIALPLDPASLASDGALTGGLAAAAGGSAAERAAVSYALGKGAVLVAPAGDNGEDGNEPTFPAAYPGVITLGAVDRHFVRAAFSSRQTYVALTAPGVNLTTASPPAGYRNMSTTGAASAVVAGIAALIRSQDPTLTSSQIREALVNGSVPRPPSATTAGYGAGTVDALKAVQAAALIATARPAASAPATARPAASAPATAQAPPGTARPAATPPRTGILGRARTVLRDAAMAAGVLIVLLLASLVGIRVRRRRAERGTLPAPEPRTLLNAPVGPLATSAGGARHTRQTAGHHAAATHMATAGATPWRTAPRAEDRRSYAPATGQAAPVWTPNPPLLPGTPAAPASGTPPRILPVPGASAFPGPLSSRLAARLGELGALPRTGDPGSGPVPARPSASTVPGGPVPANTAAGGRTRRRAWSRGRSGRYRTGSRISAHGLRMPVTPAAGTVTQAQVAVPGGPPWEPARMPEGGLPHEAMHRVTDPFALFPPPAPAASAPWEVPPPGRAVPPGPPPTAGQPGAPWPYARPAGSRGEPPPIPLEPRSLPSRRGPAGPPSPALPTGPVPPAPPAPSAGPVPTIGPRFAGGPPQPLTPPGPPGAPQPPTPLIPPGPPGPGGAGPLGGRLPIARPSSFAGSSGPPPEPSPGPRDAGPGPAPPPSPPGGGYPGPRRSPYSGRHVSDADAGENQGGGPAGSAASPGDGPPSGPLYVWNPGAPTEPFPPASPPRTPGEPADPGEPDTGPPQP